MGEEEKKNQAGWCAMLILRIGLVADESSSGPSAQWCVHQDYGYNFTA